MDRFHMGSLRRVPDWLLRSTAFALTNTKPFLSSLKWNETAPTWVWGQTNWNAPTLCSTEHSKARSRKFRATGQNCGTTFMLGGSHSGCLQLARGNKAMFCKKLKTNPQVGQRIEPPILAIRGTEDLIRHRIIMNSYQASQTSIGAMGPG